MYRVIEKDIQHECLAYTCMCTYMGEHVYTHSWAYTQTPIKSWQLFVMRHKITSAYRRATLSLTYTAVK